MLLYHLHSWFCSLKRCFFFVLSLAVAGYICCGSQRLCLLWQHMGASAVDGNLSDRFVHVYMPLSVFPVN